MVGDQKTKRQVASAIAECCQDLGFLVITGHGLDAHALERAFTLTRNFMDLPQSKKDLWYPTGPSKQRGYHGVATRGLASTIGKTFPLDLRESLFVGPVEDHQAYFSNNAEAQLAYSPNNIPNEPIGIEDALITLYRNFENLSSKLLRIFAVALKLNEYHFASKIDRHFSILSSHHYPALSSPPLQDQLRTGPHTDFGALTILAMTGASAGLEVLLHNGEWRSIETVQNELVVNLGDMMARWTNDRWTSTMHRVANPANPCDAASRRQSIGYFMHPNFDAKIECLPTCLNSGDQPRYNPITAGEHIAMKISKSH